MKSCYLSSGCLLLLSSTYALADDSVETMIETNGVNAEMIHLTSIGSDYRVTPSLLFMDETQGTLDLPLVNNAIDGVNQTDGWPVSMPISVYFKGQELQMEISRVGFMYLSYRLRYLN